MEPIDEREEGESKSDEQGRERRRVEGVNPKKHERPYNPFRKHPNLINEPSRCPIFLLRSRAGDISEGRKSVSERNLMVRFFSFCCPIWFFFFYPLLSF